MKILLGSYMFFYGLIKFHILPLFFLQNIFDLYIYKKHDIYKNYFLTQINFFETVVI